MALEKIKLGNLEVEPVKDFFKKKAKLTIDEKQIMEMLVAKYNDNFSKMFKDIKINKWQWNKNQLKKLYERYLEAYESFPVAKNV